MTRTNPLKIKDLRSCPSAESDPFVLYNDAPIIKYVDVPILDPQGHSIGLMAFRFEGDQMDTSDQDLEFLKRTMAVLYQIIHKIDMVNSMDNK